MSDQGFLEDQNIVNLIEFYSEELGLLHEGVSVDEIFDKARLRKLRKRGIIGYSNYHWFLTEKVKDILRARAPTLVRLR
jgi:hypothetical protein